MRLHCSTNVQNCSLNLPNWISTPVNTYRKALSLSIRVQCEGQTESQHAGTCLKPFVSHLGLLSSYKLIARSKRVDSIVFPTPLDQISPSKVKPPSAHWCSPPVIVSNMPVRSMTSGLIHNRAQNRCSYTSVCIPS